jgi:hypothetical protein
LAAYHAFGRMSLAGTTYINAGEYKSNINSGYDKSLSMVEGVTSLKRGIHAALKYTPPRCRCNCIKAAVYDVYLYNNSTLLFSGGAAESHL